MSRFNDYALRLRRYPRLREAVRTFRRARRRTFERLGSDRYSRPGLDDLDRLIATYVPQRDGVFVEAGAYDG